MDKLTLYKQIYDFELDRKDKIFLRINFVATILILVIGILAYFIKELIKLPKFNYFIKELPQIENFYMLIFILLLIISAIGIAIAFIYLLKVIFGNNYKALPVTNLIDNDFKKLEDYANKILQVKQDFNLTDDEIKEHYNFTSVENEFNSYLMEKYQNISNHNGTDNDNKEDRIYKALMYLVFSIIIISISLIPYGITIYKHIIK